MVGPPWTEYERFNIRFVGRFYTILCVRCKKIIRGEGYEVHRYRAYRFNRGTIKLSTKMVCKKCFVWGKATWSGIFMGLSLAPLIIYFSSLIMSFIFPSYNSTFLFIRGVSFFLSILLLFLITPAVTGSALHLTKKKWEVGKKPFLMLLFTTMIPILAIYYAYIMRLLVF